MLEAIPTLCGNNFCLLQEHLLSRLAMEDIYRNINKELFRRFLSQEFESRIKKNPSYSLRAYARSLNIHASCLSVILKNKRPLTPQLIKRFSQALELSPQNINELCSNNQYPNNRQVLTADVFEVISNWLHFAILELVKLEDFQPQIQWIAQTLEVQSIEVQNAVERLIRCELLEIENDKWRVIKDTDIYVDEFTTLALKKYQQSILYKSIDAIKEVDIDRRYHGTTTMAIAKKDFNKAKEKLRKFKEDFCIDMQSSSEFYNDVYQLQMGFFPLTKGDKIG